MSVDELRAADRAAGSRQCQGCGCTQRFGCTPPCWWVEPDLCSTCTVDSPPDAATVWRTVMDIVDGLNLLHDRLNMIAELLVVDFDDPPRPVVDTADLSTYEPEEGP